jgi:hypothetical protein
VSQPNLFAAARDRQIDGARYSELQVRLVVEVVDRWRHGMR